MIRRTIAAGLLPLLMACGGGSSGQDTGHISNQAKIMDWQARQRTSPVVTQPKVTGPTGDLFADITYTVQRLPYIRPVEDQGVDHWQTEAETVERGAGDCEDMAAMVYTALLASGLLEHYGADAFMRWMTYPNAPAHMIVVVHADDGQTVYISNLWVYEGVDDPGTVLVDFDLWSVYWGGAV